MSGVITCHQAGKPMVKPAAMAKPELKTDKQQVDRQQNSGADADDRVEMGRRFKIAGQRAADQVTRQNIGGCQARAEERLNARNRRQGIRKAPAISGMMGRIGPTKRPIITLLPP